VRATALLARDLIDPPFDPTPFSIDERRAIDAWRAHGRPDVADNAELWTFCERDRQAQQDALARSESLAKALQRGLRFRATHRSGGAGRRDSNTAPASEKMSPKLDYAKSKQV
jgi:hypothetical protein